MHAFLLLEFLNKVKWVLQTNTSTKAKVDLRNLFSLSIFLQDFLASWKYCGYCRLQRWAFWSLGYPVVIGGFPGSSQIWEDQLVPPTARRNLWRLFWKIPHFSDPEEGLFFFHLWKKISCPISPLPLFSTEQTQKSEAFSLTDLSLHQEHYRRLFWGSPV